MFLDKSKAFGKVWHEGLILKLSHNDHICKIVESFKRFFKIPKAKGGVKWSKLFLERNHFRCPTRIYFGTSFDLDLY